MAQIKKAYQAIMAVLAENMDAQVSDIYAEVEALASAKSGGTGGNATSFHKDEDGNLVGIKCYYHKLWFNPEVVEFGKKSGSPTGLNSMCKDGNSKWTKQQSAFKKAKEQLLADVAAGEVDAADIGSILAELEEAKNVIVPNDELVGYETLEELLAAQ
jgi:hypothetical protein